MTTTPGEATAVLADIGGTNARFALLHAEETGPVLHLSVADHDTAYDALAAALDRFGVQSSPPTAVLAFAGPVDPEHAQMTNTGWQTTAGELGRRFGFANVKLINDYAALALGLNQFAGQDRRPIGRPRAASVGTLAVVGPGSGLGVAALIPSSPHPLPLVCEGGHATIAAANQLESDLIAILRERFGHVSAERLLSGPGLVNIHGALARLEGTKAPAIDAAQITQQGLDGTNPLCRRVLETFCGLLGSFAGNMALCYGAHAGVYLGGGILPRFPEFLAASEFRSRFESKGRLTDYLGAIPTWLITRPDATFTGLAVSARQFD